MSKDHDSRLFKHLRRWLKGAPGMRSKHGANLALDILAENGIAEIAVRTASGRLVHLSTRDKVVASMILRTGAFDRSNMTAFAALLERGGIQPRATTFVNVGANIGATCLNAYEIGFRRFVAIEPEPENFRLLGLNLTGLPAAHVTLHNVAVGDKAGKAVLHCHPSNLGAHSLVADRAARTGADTIEVAVVPLADLIDDDAPFVLLVDVEGYEPQVLRGGGVALERNCRAMALEVSPSKYAVDDAADLCHRIAAFGREIEVLQSSERARANDLPRLMAASSRGHFDIALLRQDGSEEAQKN